MTSIEVPELGGGLDGGVGVLVGRRTRRRDEFEALGLLLGILAILLILALTFGALPQI